MKQNSVYRKNAFRREHPIRPSVKSGLGVAVRCLQLGWVLAVAFLFSGCTRSRDVTPAEYAAFMEAGATERALHQTDSFLLYGMFYAARDVADIPFTVVNHFVISPKIDDASTTASQARLLPVIRLAKPKDAQGREIEDAPQWTMEDGLDYVVLGAVLLGGGHANRAVFPSHTLYGGVLADIGIYGGAGILAFGVAMQAYPWTLMPLESALLRRPYDTSLHRKSRMHHLQFFPNLRRTLGLRRYAAQAKGMKSGGAAE